MKFEKNSRQLGRVELIFILLVILSISAVVLFVLSSSKNKQSSIDSFDSCVAAGNPVNLSYPESCNANGKVFTNSSRSDSLKSD